MPCEQRYLATASDVLTHAANATASIPVDDLRTRRWDGEQYIRRTAERLGVPHLYDEALCAVNEHLAPEHTSIWDWSTRSLRTRFSISGMLYEAAKHAAHSEVHSA